MREEVEREKRRWQKSETGMREQDRSEEETQKIEIAREIWSVKVLFQEREEG